MLPLMAAVISLPVAANAGLTTSQISIKSEDRVRMLFSCKFVRRPTIVSILLYCVVRNECCLPSYVTSGRIATLFVPLTGGAIGEGPGAATGAAIACPDRKVTQIAPMPG